MYRFETDKTHLSSYIKSKLTPIETVENNELVTILIAVTAPIVAGIIAFFTIRYAKKSHERTAMIDVFHMLNDDKQKKTEDEIIEKFKEGSINEFLKSSDSQNDVKKVWRNYDQIGLLVDKNLIPKEEFFHLFGLKMVSLYFCLSSEIEQRRLTRPFSLMYFTNMAIDCWEYWNKKGREIFNPATNGPIKRSDLGKKVKP